MHYFLFPMNYMESWECKIIGKKGFTDMKTIVKQMDIILQCEHCMPYTQVKHLLSTSIFMCIWFWIKNKTPVTDKQSYQQHCCCHLTMYFKWKYDPTFGKYTNSNTVSLRHYPHAFIKNAGRKKSKRHMNTDINNVWFLLLATTRCEFWRLWV